MTREDAMREQVRGQLGQISELLKVFDESDLRDLRKALQVLIDEGRELVQRPLRN